MPNSVPLSFRSAPFPEGYSATPEQFKNDLVARLSAETTDPVSFFAAGAVMPTSDVGPWLQDYVEWMVWSETLGTYTFQRISSQALKYIASASAPDQTIYTFWIELNGSGKAIDIKYYSGGAWKSIYEDKFAAYDASIAAINSNLTNNYYTIAQANAAISNSAAATLASANSYTDTSFGVLRPYPAQGVRNAQTVDTNGIPVRVEFNLAPVNPAPAPFNTTTYRYVVPANGFYSVSFGSQFDAGTNDAATTEVVVSLYKNGYFVGSGLSDIDNTPNPAGDRWSPSFSGLVQANVGDYLEIYVFVTDGPGTGNVVLAVGQVSIFRVSE